MPFFLYRMLYRHLSEKDTSVPSLAFELALYLLVLDLWLYFLELDSNGLKLRPFIRVDNNRYGNR
jgi:hypothetical protein